MNQNETKPLTVEGILDELYRHVAKEINDDMAWDTAIQQIDQYAAQQVKQVTEERDELARLISDNPLCDTVVDPTLQRAWEACTTLCEKAEFKFLFKYAQNMEKRAKDTTDEREKAVELLKRCLHKNEPTYHGLLSASQEIIAFLNSLNATKS